MTPGGPGAPEQGMTTIDLLEAAAAFCAMERAPNMAAELRTRAARLRVSLTQAALERHWDFSLRIDADTVLRAVNAPAAPTGTTRGGDE